MFKEERGGHGWSTEWRGEHGRPDSSSQRALKAMSRNFLFILRARERDWKVFVRTVSSDWVLKRSVLLQCGDSTQEGPKWAWGSQEKLLWSRREDSSSDHRVTVLVEGEMTDCRDNEEGNPAEPGDSLAKTVRWREKKMSKSSLMSCKLHRWWYHSSSLKYFIECLLWAKAHTKFFCLLLLFSNSGIQISINATNYHVWNIPFEPHHPTTLTNAPRPKSRWSGNIIVHILWRKN